MASARLGDILIERGWVSAEALDSVLKLQEARGGMLGMFLVKQGLINSRQLGEALSIQLKVPFQPIDPQLINPQVVRLLPERLARQRKMAPVTINAGSLTLAMAAPDDIEAISEVELITGYHVTPVVGIPTDIEDLLDRGYDERITARQTIVDLKLAELREKRERGELAETNAVEDEDAPVVKLVRSILMGAVNAGASDIHLEPHQPQMRVRYRVDGQLQQVMTIPTQSEEAVVGRIKVMADMDTTEKRKPQDGNLSLEEKGMRASFRVSTIPTVDGEKVVMRVIDEDSKVFTFAALGMPEKQTAIVRELINKPHGMIVMTGPTGSGKTTTMYTMLTNINANENNISTVEDPVEFKLPGINQVHANSEHGMGFANALKYLMRQDPDVIMVGEIRDAETAQTAVQAALTGHLLISTLHTNDAVGAVQRLQDLGVDKFKIGGSLLAAIAQRLLRKICVHCKEPAPLNEKLLTQIAHGRKIPQQPRFFAGKGCPKCLGTGFMGRVPVYEIMVVTPNVANAIETGLPYSKLRDLAILEGMEDLTTNGLALALAGETTLEEVYYRLSS
ncbi:MAG: GspE/PulE family protein [Pirellulales bacterium]|nr:GspE/PulE family protein [Pirellulales bacterium]